eukprot:gene37663-4737_t
MGGGCCGWLVRIAAHPDDSCEERRRKEIALPLFAATWCVSIYHQGGDTLGILLTTVTRRLPVGLCEAAMAAMVSYAWGVLLTDVTSLAYRKQFWSVMVLVVDGMLVLGCRECVSFTVVAVTCAWLVIRNAEETLTFGLTQLINVSPDAPMQVRRCGDEGSCLEACHHKTIGATYGTAAVLQCLALRRAEAAVQLAEEVAGALVRFDLQRAAEPLTE